MVDRLILAMRAEWGPKDQAPEDIVDDDENVQSPEPLEFFIKMSKRVGALSDLKFHVKAVAGQDEAKTACQKLNMTDLVSIGTATPETKLICAACVKARDLMI